MAWAPANEKPKPFDTALYKDEGHWNSAYPDSQDRWVKDFKPHYDLIGVYEVDKNVSLYRFMRDESLKHELSPYSPRFYNVTIMHINQDDNA